jgi:cell division septum initiation protein DivIVA
MTILTLETLKEKHACEEQLALFHKTFGTSVDVTPELCESVADKFNFRWAVEKLLLPDERDEYKRVTAPALAEYERVTGLASAEYERVMGLASAEYERVKESAWAEYKRFMGLASAEYERIMAPARAEYERVTARAFGELFCKQ